MKAQSSVYIRLQNIYKAKARQDAAEILELAHASPGGEDIDPEEVELFCKNAAFIKLVHASANSPEVIRQVVGKLSGAGWGFHLGLL
jgi:NEDD8-activating enzyme E1 regulatory subunit